MSGASTHAPISFQSAHLYERVADRITHLIDQGTLRPGDRVPSIRKLVRQQSVSVSTVLQAYQLLEGRGLIEARPKSGFYVRARRWTPAPEPEVFRPAERHLRRLCHTYAQLMQRMSASLARNFPAGTRVSRPQGGQVLWVELPGKVDTMELHRAALSNGTSSLWPSVRGAHSRRTFSTARFPFC